MQKALKEAKNVQPVIENVVKEEQEDETKQGPQLADLGVSDKEQ